MAWTKVADYTVVDCSEYFWELEEFRDKSPSAAGAAPDGSGDQQFMLVHLKVRKWSKDVLKSMRAAFLTFRDVVTCPLYAVHPVEDDKWVKFIAYFGFKPLTEITCENGERRTLFINLANVKNNNEQFDGTPSEHHRAVHGEPVGPAG